MNDDDSWLDELAAFDLCGYKLQPVDDDPIRDLIHGWDFTS